MTLEKGYKTELSVDGVTIDQRDIEMLEAIDQHGSMHAAADALGRSYARLQQRIVELEGALGDLTERRRGGKDGGGTELTSTALEVRRQFERHRTELDGVARATESVFAGTVRERTGTLGTVDTAVGPVVALVPAGATTVQVGVRSDAVVLSDPEESSTGGETSFRNRFTGTVSSVDSNAGVAKVTLELERACEPTAGSESIADIELETLITEESVDSLEIVVGKTLCASFKATAARAIPMASAPSADDHSE
ncbi:molybdenum-binding protein [Halostagnicola larsenii XH-48]|uniref:Molybdenum-binding protein n=1 Tax=Halostagnicola larsenii XH-48 TaxID=797299 RepID=W0JT54_9EURY|nr:LysR family transcriptional regulator [Halostagnicola larsenii]AHG00405.1 molybdenum-binding protein [Halostagnicola larsenii XH-48]